MTAIESPIVVACPSGHKFRVQAKADGLRVRCPSCKAPVAVRRHSLTVGDAGGEQTDFGELNESAEGRHGHGSGPTSITMEQLDFHSMDLPPNLPTDPPFPALASIRQAATDDAKTSETLLIKSEPASKHAYVQAAVVLLCLLLSVEILGFAISMSKTTKWEYKLESPSDSNFESAVDRMGDQGWELVFARRATSSFGIAGYEMIFKRPK